MPQPPDLSEEVTALRREGVKFPEPDSHAMAACFARGDAHNVAKAILAGLALDKPELFARRKP
jgi:hypothetical protein